MKRIGDINDLLMARAAEDCDGEQVTAKALLAVAMRAIDADQNDDQALKLYVALIGNFHDELVAILFGGEAIS